MKHIEGQCPVCKRTFTPRRARLETMVYCSQKCCNFTSTHPDAVTEKSPERDVILKREWAAIEWAQEQMTQLDKEQGLPLTRSAGSPLISAPSKPLVCLS